MKVEACGDVFDVGVLGVVEGTFSAVMLYVTAKEYRPCVVVSDVPLTAFGLVDLALEFLEGRLLGNTQ